MGTNETIVGSRLIYGSEKQPFGISQRDRRQHTLVLGKSGTGKSTLFENMALQDAANGMGFAFIDPHGDSIRVILERLPKSRHEDVVLFDPSDVDFPVALNVFYEVPERRRPMVASGLIEAFKSIWKDSWGPRLEYILYAAIAAVLECQDVSLLSVQRMLSDADYRAWVVRQVKDPILQSFWLDEFERYDKRFRAEAVAPIQNKIGQLVMSPLLRNILGQVKSRIESRYLIDKKKIFLVDISKGKIGPDKSALLGALLMSQFYTAAMSRADTPGDLRHDYALYADEFTSFVSGSLAPMLSETRKYGLSIVLGTHFLMEMEPALMQAVLGNVGSIIAFRVGPDDAAILEKAFSGNVKARDFTALDNGRVIAKLLTAGREGWPIEGWTHERRPPQRQSVDTIVARSRQRFSLPREIVESKIKKWSRRNAQTAGPFKDWRRKTHSRRKIALNPPKRPGMSPPLSS